MLLDAFRGSHHRLHCKVTQQQGIGLQILEGKLTGNEGSGPPVGVPDLFAAGLPIGDSDPSIEVTGVLLGTGDLCGGDGVVDWQSHIHRAEGPSGS
ncbi:hypothetical protein CDL15_Pgr021474 [Punica granatum]|uniref:Uncharacterized protein n=2 Tax=Punica granatum TaxID=22663 RepID=A0A218XNN2_PUNGR|nr:hypothetical protein CDL15_Pgr021474 [Punica granatum]